MQRSIPVLADSFLNVRADAERISRTTDDNHSNLGISSHINWPIEAIKHFSSERIPPTWPIHLDSSHSIRQFQTHGMMIIH